MILISYENTMKLRGFLITVSDIDKAKQFYQDLFGLKILADYDGNVVMSEGLFLQDKKIWQKFINKEIISESNSSELYFEQTDLASFIHKLESLYPQIKYV